MIWPSIDPGRLRHVIDIQQQQQGSDASGTNVSWALFTRARAAIDPVRGIDVIRSGQDTTHLFVTITMFWQGGILPNMRIVADTGSVFVVQSIENLQELNVVLQLNCLGLGNNQ